MSRCVGHLNVRDVRSSGRTHEGQKYLDIEVETLPADPPLAIKQANKDMPLVLSWLQLNVEIRTSQVPRRHIGRVVIDEAGMLPVDVKRSGPAQWLWEVLPEDVEKMEVSRSVSPGSPIYLAIEVTGIAKLVDVTSGNDITVVPVRGRSTQFNIEPSQWDRLLQQLDYTVPPSQSALGSAASVEHQSWTDAVKRLEGARSHHREGEDYEALRGCLSALEAIVHAPYNKPSWIQQLTSLPEQKADGLAEMFSGIATPCNKIGHHRGRIERDTGGDLPAMPLNHWEADLAPALTQFALTYELRLRAAGILVVLPPVATAAPTGATPPCLSRRTTSPAEAIRNVCATWLGSARPRAALSKPCSWQFRAHSS